MCLISEGWDYLTHKPVGPGFLHQWTAPTVTCWYLKARDTRVGLIHHFREVRLGPAHIAEPPNAQELKSKIV